MLSAGCSCSDVVHQHRTRGHDHVNGRGPPKAPEGMEKGVGRQLGGGPAGAADVALVGPRWFSLRAPRRARSADLSTTRSEHDERRRHTRRRRGDGQGGVKRALKEAEVREVRATRAAGKVRVREAAKQRRGTGHRHPVTIITPRTQPRSPDPEDNRERVQGGICTATLSVSALVLTSGTLTMERSSLLSVVLMKTGPVRCVST
mmetsp:Transcript_16472/g.40556  ORF Transcript_16472/g.40556 Transcript_16472/m.40556 type:complete len:204 (+) Transcript_16472:2682-3293(+)